MESPKPSSKASDPSPNSVSRSTWLRRTSLVSLLLILSVLKLAFQYVESAKAACGSCARAEDHGIIIPVMGLGMYSLVWALMILKKNGLAELLTFVSFCAHAVLSTSLILSGQHCLLCYTAFAASGLLWYSLIEEVSRVDVVLHGALCLIVVGGGVLLTDFLPVNKKSFQYLNRVPPALFTIEKGPPTLVLIEQSGCKVCDDFHSKIEPRLREEFKDQLRIVSLNNEQVKANDVPTFLVGRKRNALYVGGSFTSYSTLRGWILQMLNES